MHRWGSCPGSVRLCAGIPDTAGKASALGTVAHAVLDNCLSNGNNPENYQGETWPQDGFNIEIDQEMVDAVWVALEHLENRRDVERGQLWNEVSLHEAMSELHPDLGGTADIVLWQPEASILDVMDYKHGSGVFVSVWENSQLKSYAVGAMLSLPQVKAKTIRVTIIQPRCGGDETVRTVDYDVLELLDFCADMVAKAKATETPDAPLVPSDGACRFCPARVTCPALEEHSTALIEADFAKQVSTLVDPAKMGELLGILPALEARIKAIREEAYNMAAQGTPPVGYKLVNKQGRRQWTDAAEARAIVDKVLAPSLARKCFTEPEMLSLAKMEKAIGKKVFAEHLGELTAMVSSGYTLAVETDKRPAALSAGDSDFDTGE